MKKRIGGALLFCFGCVIVLGFVSIDQEKIAPSEALEKFEAARSAAIDANGGRLSQEIYLGLRKKAAELITTVQTGELSDDERFSLSELLYFAGKSDESLAIKKELMQGEGFAAQQAYVKYLNSIALDRSLGEERFKEVEEKINEYRSRFSPSPELSANLYFPVDMLAFYYAENGEHEKVVQAVMAEVETLDLNAPYLSYLIISRHSESFVEAGQKELLLQMCTSIGEKLSAIARQRGKDPQAEDKKFAETTTRYSSIGSTLTSTARRMKLVGDPAPGFTFTHFFNTEPFEFDELKGKVVMIDFWANWCGPCKVAFPHMRELYNKYKEKGFVIVSVTSLQGYFIDGDIQERPVGGEREIELTADLIKRHEMTWPVVVSDRSCFDPEYGVTGIPTFALIGRDGTVKHIGVGAGEQTAATLEEWLPKLLAE